MSNLTIALLIMVAELLMVLFVMSFLHGRFDRRSSCARVGKKEAAAAEKESWEGAVRQLVDYRRRLRQELAQPGMLSGGGERQSSLQAALELAESAVGRIMTDDGISLISCREMIRNLEVIIHVIEAEARNAALSGVRPAQQAGAAPERPPLNVREIMLAQMTDDI